MSANTILTNRLTAGKFIAQSDGICFGISILWLKAAFQGQLRNFYLQLNSSLQNPNYFSSPDGKTFAESIAAYQRGQILQYATTDASMLQTCTLMNPHAQQLLQTKFDGPTNNTQEMFNLQLILPTIITQMNYQNIFTNLADYALSSQKIIAFICLAEEHAVAFFYKKQTQQWSIFNINQYSSHEAYIRKNTNEMFNTLKWFFHPRSSSLACNVFVLNFSAYEEQSFDIDITQQLYQKYSKENQQHNDTSTTLSRLIVESMHPGMLSIACKNGLHFTQEDFEYACCNTNQDFIAVFLKIYRSQLHFYLNHFNDTGGSSIHCACLAGNYKAISLLVNAGANVNLRTRNEKQTALHLAALEGDENSVTTLIMHHADPLLKDITGKTALNYAETSANTTSKNSVIQILKSAESRQLSNQQHPEHH